MQAFADRILTKTRKKWLRVQPLFKPFKPVRDTEVNRIESKVGAPLPKDLKAWLLAVGYGDVHETLSFRYDWFHTIKGGHLSGAVIFAQDDLGNFYAYSISDGSIYFFERSTPEYATVSPSFRAFMEELERRDFKLDEWMDGVALMPYDRDA
jgi:hypothetical protein